MGRRVLSHVARGSGCPTATRWRCVGPAAASQAAHDEIERQLDAGEPLSLEAFGDWKPTVPKGMVGVKFVSRAGVFHRLMPEADYPNQRVAPFRGTDILRVQVLDPYLSNRQYLWIKIFYAASSGRLSSGRSTSLPFSKFAPARTSATRWGALTARQRDWAASISL